MGFIGQDEGEEEIPGWTSKSEHIMPLAPGLGQRKGNPEGGH